MSQPYEYYTARYTFIVIDLYGEEHEVYAASPRHAAAKAFGISCDRLQRANGAHYDCAVYSSTGTRSTWVVVR